MFTFRKPIYDFPERVKALEDLPPATAAVVLQQVPAAAVQSILTLPPQSYPIGRSTRWRILPFGWRVTPHRTLVFTPDALLVVELERAGGLTARRIPLAGLLGLRLETNLLYGCLELDWAEDDQAHTLALEFNTVGERLLRRDVDRFLAALPSGGGQAAEAGLGHLPYKFRNMLRLALLPGEVIQAAIFQPELGRALEWFRPRLAPNRAIALTDRHVIVVEEDEARHVTSYGLTIGHYPRRGVRGLRFETRGELVWATLSLGLGAVSLEKHFPLTGENAAALEEACAALDVAIRPA